jgi:GNAT superfamily N-acetyltransferase
MATVADAAEVVRLACVMFTSMGMDDPGDAWRTMSADHFTRRIGRDAIAAVVDHPTISTRLISSGAATVSTRLPTPSNPTGAHGYVQWVATDEEFRGRGCARAVMTNLLEWFDARGGEVELHATKLGEPLYRSLGFWEGNGAPSLRRRGWDLPPRTG